MQASESRSPLPFSLACWSKDTTCGIGEIRFCQVLSVSVRFCRDMSGFVRFRVCFSFQFTRVSADNSRITPDNSFGQFIDCPGFVSDSPGVCVRFPWGFPDKCGATFRKTPGDAAANAAGFYSYYGFFQRCKRSFHSEWSSGTWRGGGTNGMFRPFMAFYAFSYFSFSSFRHILNIDVCLTLFYCRFLSNYASGYNSFRIFEVGNWTFPEEKSPSA